MLLWRTSSFATADQCCQSCFEMVGQASGPTASRPKSGGPAPGGPDRLAAQSGGADSPSPLSDATEAAYHFDPSAKPFFAHDGIQFQPEADGPL